MIGETPGRRRSIQFECFLDRIDQTVPLDLTAHIVVDNSRSTPAALLDVPEFWSVGRTDSVERRFGANRLTNAQGRSTVLQMRTRRNLPLSQLKVIFPPSL